MAGKGHDIYLDSGMKKGILKIMILGYIYGHKTYPYALLKAMKTTTGMHGSSAFKDITKNDIYNLTSSLEKDGFIRGRTRLNGNKVQKIFAVTAKGRNVVRNKERVLNEMIKALTRLVKEEGFDG